MIVILVVVLRDVVATRKSNGNRDSAESPWLGTPLMCPGYGKI